MSPSPRLLRQEIKTHTEVLNRSWTSNIVVSVCNYYLELTQKRDFGFYQYAVSYNPEIEHNKFHPRLLYDNTMILDNVHFFIEMTLYLPSCYRTWSHTTSPRVSVTTRTYTSQSSTLQNCMGNLPPPCIYTTQCSVSCWRGGYRADGCPTQQQ